jgi:hypothetical protein
MKILNEGSWSPGQSLNRTPPECKSEALLFEQTCLIEWPFYNVALLYFGLIRWVI